MAYDKKTFLKKVTVLCDTNEQKNGHIQKSFDEMSVKWRNENLGFGDYSFEIDGLNFCLTCVIERKANVNELYGNIMQDRERLEREFSAGSTLACEFSLLIENCKDMQTLKDYKVSEWEMKAFNRKEREIGKHCYQTLQSWQSGNKYRFNTIFAENKDETAAKILERFYYFWRNYKILLANRKNTQKKEKGAKKDV